MIFRDSKLSCVTQVLLHGAAGVPRTRASTHAQQTTYDTTKYDTEVKTTSSKTVFDVSVTLSFLIKQI